jgi:microsomal dipeptidase-like Zn-dependent dipeptidase
MYHVLSITLCLSLIPPFNSGTLEHQLHETRRRLEGMRRKGRRHRRQSRAAHHAIAKVMGQNVLRVLEESWAR